MHLSVTMPCAIFNYLVVVVVVGSGGGGGGCGGVDIIITIAQRGLHLTTFLWNWIQKIGSHNSASLAYMRVTPHTHTYTHT